MRHVFAGMHSCSGFELNNLLLLPAGRGNRAPTSSVHPHPVYRCFKCLSQHARSGHAGRVGKVGEWARNQAHWWVSGERLGCSTHVCNTFINSRLYGTRPDRSNSLWRTSLNSWAVRPLGMSGVKCCKWELRWYVMYIILMYSKQ